MGSREREQTKAHQPHLSSLVVRPTESGGGSDYEPGEVRRDPPPYSRSDRFSDNPGYGMHAGSGSPLRHRKVVHRYSPDFDHTDGRPRGRGFRGGRGPGRFRYSSPPYGRGRGGGRSSGRGFDGPRYSPEPGRGEGMSRNNPNVPPREGDWICTDPVCGNLNFARREYCNNCDKFRFEPVEIPRRNYPSSPRPRSPLPRFSGSPLDRSPFRSMSGYRPPPRGWGRDSPREFGGGPPHPSQGGRFPPDHYIQRERLEYREEDDYMERNKFDRPIPQEWGRGDRGRDNFFPERRGYDGRNERRPLSPPLPLLPPRGRWAHDVRERSPSPIRGGLPPKEYRRDSYMDRGRDDDARERSRSPVRGVPPPKDYRRESFMGRGREDRRGMTRGRIGNPY